VPRRAALEAVGERWHGICRGFFRGQSIQNNAHGLSAFSCPLFAAPGQQRHDGNADLGTANASYLATSPFHPNRMECLSSKLCEENRQTRNFTLGISLAKLNKPTRKIMTKTNYHIPVLIIALVAMPLLKADDSKSPDFFKKGDVLAELSGSFNHASYNSGSESGTVNFVYADLGASYFFTSELSSGADTFWLYVPKIGDSDASAKAVGLEWNGRYHFKVSRYFQPYVGLHTGYAWGSVQGSGDTESHHINTLGGHVGFVIPINDNVFFDVQVKYTDFRLHVPGIKLDTTRVLFGLKIKL
jgi:opacity protein-like surface antigen